MKKLIGRLADRLIGRTLNHAIILFFVAISGAGDASDHCENRQRY
jgi:hypothetical protein